MVEVVTQPVVLAVAVEPGAIGVALKEKILEGFLSRSQRLPWMQQRILLPWAPEGQITDQRATPEHRGAIQNLEMLFLLVEVEEQVLHSPEALVVPEVALMETLSPEEQEQMPKGLVVELLAPTSPLFIQVEVAVVQEVLEQRVLVEALREMEELV